MVGPRQPATRNISHRAFHLARALGNEERIAAGLGRLAGQRLHVFGDIVNLASRLEGLNKLYGTAIMAAGIRSRNDQRACLAVLPW